MLSQKVGKLLQRISFQTTSRNSSVNHSAQIIQEPVDRYQRRTSQSSLESLSDISVRLMEILNTFFPLCKTQHFLVPYRVKSVISIMIIHICLAMMIISLPLSSHLAISRSSFCFSILNFSTSSCILAFSSGGSSLIILCKGGRV